MLAEEFFRPLGRSRVPTLVTGGRSGPFPPSVFEDTANLVPGSRLLLLDRAGHYPWYDQPDQLRDAIVTFLNQA